MLGTIRIEARRNLPGTAVPAVQAALARATSETSPTKNAAPREAGRRFDESTEVERGYFVGTVAIV